VGTIYVVDPVGLSVINPAGTVSVATESVDVSESTSEPVENPEPESDSVEASDSLEGSELGLVMNVAGGSSVVVCSAPGPEVVVKVASGRGSSTWVEKNWARAGDVLARRVRRRRGRECILSIVLVVDVVMREKKLVRKLPRAGTRVSVRCAVDF
jgi:hypothetical protein